MMRYRQILAIVFKYGFGNIIDALNIEQYLEIGLQLISRNRREKVERMTNSRRLRMILEELGPTFIKFGQILSSRPDLIPVDLLNELARLQDRVPPFSFDEVAAILTAEFGKPWTEVFIHIDEKPSASASIGQVHRARLTDGTTVAVKVQRPGIRKIIEVDLEIMHHLATLMERHVEEIAVHQPVNIVEEFAKSLSRELDYTIEASNMRRVTRQFAGDSTIYVPAVFAEESTQRVLTMEYVSGIKVSDLESLDRQGLDRKRVTDRGFRFILRQVFEFGFFHGDPHPGNIFILPGEVICPIDYGITGYLSRNVRESFIDLIYCLNAGKTRLAARALLELADYSQEPDIGRLERDISEFVGLHLDRPLADIQVGQLLNDILEMAAHNGLRIPPDLFLMMKAFASVEGIGRMLDPDFNMFEHAAPFIRQIKMARLAPDRVAEDVGGIARESIRFMRLFPADILELTRLAKQGKVSFTLRLEGLNGCCRPIIRSVIGLPFPLLSLP